MAKRISSPLTVLRFSCWHFSEASRNVSATYWPPIRDNYVPSLVMKDMNSDTHSCIHSFASFAILAFSGRADFMILATGAKFCMLASVCRCALSALLKAPLDDKRWAGGDEDDCGEDEGIAIRASHQPGCASRRLQMVGFQRSF